MRINKDPWAIEVVFDLTSPTQVSNFFKLCKFIYISFSQNHSCLTNLILNPVFVFWFEKDENQQRFMDKRGYI